MRPGRKPRAEVPRSAAVTALIVRLHEAPHMLTFVAIAQRLGDDFGIRLTPAAVWQRYESRRTIDEAERRMGERSYMY